MIRCGCPIVIAAIVVAVASVVVAVAVTLLNGWACLLAELGEFALAADFELLSLRCAH